MGGNTDREGSSGLAILSTAQFLCVQSVLETEGPLLHVTFFALSLASRFLLFPGAYKT